VRETGDHGSFNSWGRDRYWELEGAPPDQLPELSNLDMAEPNVIRNSRWRCDHGWDIDLDDGSSRYEIYNNLLLGGGLKLREGFHRKAYNNVIVNNSLHPHVWYPNSGDVFTHNIVMGAYRPALMTEDGKWGQEVDRNLFTHEADRVKFAKNGCDAHSLAGNPMFVDAANGDFRVREDSPALKLGFKNFPMDRFGVQKPSLKARARTPEIPKPDRTDVESAEVANSYSWLGATVRNLAGAEFSAVGVAAEKGGALIEKLPSDSEAARYGFEPGDLIQSVNGQPVKTASDLERAIKSSSKNGPFTVIVRHRQQEKTLILSAPLKVPRVQ
jgi:hypothetical protein